ncbi:hypothetical protein [Thauera butanivorans]|uniref:hypothetical protein n=1 Tax=Thauera butanivorans TaxID=86174 RepID=UPI0012FC1CD4|nr:hypothetical protein [Thauera butanivorans]
MILLAVLVAGFLFVAGTKAAHWLIPDPPREPLKLKLDIDPEEPATPAPQRQSTRSTL